jgi:hypothetical protein
MSKQSVVKLGVPSEAYALRYCSVLLSFSQQPYQAELYSQIIGTFGFAFANKIKQKVVAAFNTARMHALNAQLVNNQGQEVDAKILGPGSRNLIPELFNEQGYHKLYAEPSIIKRCTEDKEWTNAFKLLFQDTIKYPDKVSNIFYKLTLNLHH